MASPALVELDEMTGKTSSDAFFSDSGLGVRSVFWWFDEEHDDWRLYVLSDYCDKHGEKATYLRLRKHLDKARLLDRLPLYRIVAARTDDPVVDRVKKQIGNFREYRRGDFRLIGVDEFPVRGSSVVAKVQGKALPTQSSGTTVDVQAKAN